MDDARTLRRADLVLRCLMVVCALCALYVINACCDVTFAGGPCADVYFCDTHACSNDGDGVFGDEQLCVAPTPGSTWTEHGRVMPDGDVVLCGVRTRALDNGWSPYATLRPDVCFPREGERVAFKSRTCNAHGCGAWTSNDVTFVGGPFACFTPGGEVPCYEGAPLRFGGMDE